MNICLIGGIYGQRGTASGYLRVTPETTLEHGLRRAGHQVTTLSHYAAADFSRFDVVHVHHLSYGAARLAADSGSSPFIFTAHDATQLSGARFSPVRAQALRFVLERADGVVCLSRAESDFQQRTYRIDARRLHTIPNGIDPACFSYHPHAGATGRPWRLLFVGQLIPLKGCDLILRAISRLEHDVTLTLAYQTAHLEDELKSLAGRLGISSKVRFAGRQDPAQLAELYRQYDLLVMASETEALPSVITEAMLCGLPFVSTRVGGIAEQSGGFGYLLESRTAEALAAGISHILTHYSRFAAQGEPMSRYARAAYSVDAMVERHLQMYRSVAGQRPRRSHWRYTAANMLARAATRRLGTRPGAPESGQSIPAEQSS